MIYAAENINEYELQAASHKLLGIFPNTYCFTKHMAEHVVNDLCNGRISTIIVRPSIG